MVGKRTSHLPRWKKDEIKELKSEIKKHSVVAIVDMRGLPARNLQKIRSDLRGLARLKVARNSMVTIALKESEGEVKKLDSYVSGQTGLIFTDTNPFKLYKLLEKTKKPAPAKAGDISPRDIVVEKGSTSFKPGPILSELQAVGIPAGVEGGKVVIRNRAVLAKAGEVISPKLADILGKMEIYPMEVGLNLRAAYEGSIIFKPETLAIDEALYIGEIAQAAQQGYNLAMNIAYPSKLTIIPLLQKAAIEARNLGVNAEVLEKAVIDKLLLKAHSEMIALASVAGSINEKAVDEELKGKLAAPKAKVEAAEEKKVAEKGKEEKKSEEKKEDKDKAEEEGAAGLGTLFG